MTCGTKTQERSSQLNFGFVDKAIFFIQDKHFSNLTPFTMNWQRQKICPHPEAVAIYCNLKGYL